MLIECMEFQVSEGFHEEKNCEAKDDMVMGTVTSGISLGLTKRTKPLLLRLVVDSEK